MTTKKLVSTRYADLANDPLAFEEWRVRYMNMRAGLTNAPGEWLAGSPPTVYGLVADVEDQDEPMLCLMITGEGKGAGPLVLQHIPGTERTWMNCICGTRFELKDDERIYPISPIAPRTLLRSHTIGWTPYRLEEAQRSLLKSEASIIMRVPDGGYLLVQSSHLEHAARMGATVWIGED